MEKPPRFLTKLRFRFISLLNAIRIRYYRLLGMSIGNRTVIGKIDVEWPSSVRIGNRCEIQSNTSFWVQNPFKVENKIVIGDNVFIGRNTEFNCCASIKIGNNCLIASSTVFVDSSHIFFKDKPINQQLTTLKSIHLEDDVWLGSGCKVLLGVQLGKGCIVGAGAVINRSIPPYEIWAGVPARKIGERKSVILDEQVSPNY